MRKALFVTLLLLLGAAWVGCGDSTHSLVPTSQLLFVRSNGSGAAVAHHSGTTRVHDFGTQPRPSSVAGGSENIMMMKNDGTSETMLSFKGQTSGTFGAVQLSMDGKLGVGTALDNNGYLQVFVASMADLTNIQIVQLTSDLQDHHVPQLSPDNKTVVFVKYNSTAGNYQAYTIKVSGGTQTLISTPSVDVIFPTYTPDGKKIVFDDDNNETIDIMNADGTNLKVLTNGQGLYYDELPSVSMDGKTIAFSRWAASETGGENIYTVNIDGTNLKQLTTTGNAWDPLFVNNKIAYVSSGDIYSMNLDGSSQKNLTNDTSYEDFMGWED